MLNIRNFLSRRIRFHEYIREDGLKTIDLPDVGYGAMCPSTLFRQLRKCNQFRLIGRVNDFKRYSINFSIDGQEYTFYSDDWGGGYVYPTENDGELAPLLKIMRSNSKFVEFGRPKEMAAIKDET